MVSRHTLKFARWIVFHVAFLGILLCVPGPVHGAAESDNMDVTINMMPKDGIAPLEVRITVAINGGNAPYKYVLRFGDGDIERGTADENVIVLSHTYKGDGRYPLSVVVTDEKGFSAVGRAGSGRSDSYEGAGKRKVLRGTARDGGRAVAKPKKPVM